MQQTDIVLRHIREKLFGCSTDSKQMHCTFEYAFTKLYLLIVYAMRMIYLPFV